MPVSFVNWVASAMSRVCPPPTESPMNVIDWPPYFALIAAACGTGGALIAVAEAARVVPAEAMPSETTRVSSATNPAPRMNRTALHGPHVLSLSCPINRGYRLTVDKAMAFLTPNPASAELLSARGEALVRAADGVVTDEAKSVVAKALVLDPKEPRARFFAGLAKEQAGNKKSALDAWMTILGEANGSEPWYADLKQRIDELALEIGDDPAARQADPKVAATGGVLGLLKQSEAPSRAAPGPTAEDIRNADAMTPNARDAMIRTMVDRLASRLEQSPRDAEGWVKLIRSRKMLGDSDAAAQALRRALDVFKDAPLEQNQIAAVARELGVSR